MAFAKRVSQVSGMPLADALRENTHVYLSFNLERDFNPSHPVWQAYLAGLAHAIDPVEWTCEFYQARQVAAPRPLPALEFGCFSFAEWEDGRIRIHFRANDPLGASSLSRARVPARQEELRAMFRHIRLHVNVPSSVVGGSWLYNIAAYRRLFPPAYLATAVYEGAEPEFMAQWGQFLNHSGQVKPTLARQFLQTIERQANVEGLLASFPYRVLRLECPIQEFYTYFL